jgi:Flp pilus assembly protein TadG
MNPMIAKLLSACRRFAGAREGNTVVTFALAFIPLVGLMGAAVDYSRANATRTAMQAAADSTALMVAQTANSETASSLQDQASTYFTALFTRGGASNLVVTATSSTTTGSTVVVSATASYKTDFMGVMGFRTIPLAVSSTAGFGNKRLRVALVLDNTGSMADASKLTALKNALSGTTGNPGLIDMLRSAAVNNGDVYVSIVPFVKDVNLGPTNYTANWIDWTSWNAANQVCTTTGGGGGGGGGHGSSNDGNNGGGGNGNGGGNGGGGNGGGGGGGGGTTTCAPADHSTWNGCVVDRGGSSAPDPANYDTNVVAPTSTIPNTLFVAEQYSSCPQAVMGLSYDWTTMKNLVTGMSAAGNTNQGIGLALGWMSLTGGGPFTMPTEDPNYQYSHVIILLSDGLNTQDRWYGTGDTCSSMMCLDYRERMTCDNAKNAGITIYTVQVNTDSEATSSVLRYCAGATAGTADPNKFFLLTSSTQIVTTFQQIGTQISKLRIAK